MRKVLLFVILSPLFIASSSVAITFDGYAFFRIDGGISLYESKKIAVKNAEQDAIKKAIRYIKETHLDLGVVTSLDDKELKQILLLDSNFDLRRTKSVTNFSPCEHQISFCFTVSSNVSIDISPQTSKSQWVALTINKYRALNDPSNSKQEYLDSLTETRFLSVTDNEVSKSVSTTTKNELTRMGWYNLQTLAITNKLIQSYKLVFKNSSIELQFDADERAYIPITRHEQVIKFNYLYNKSYIDQYMMLSSVMVDDHAIEVKNSIQTVFNSKNRTVVIPMTKKQIQQLTIKNKVVRNENH